MKTLIRFFKNFLMFLILPFTWWKVESCGSIGLGFNTMLREKYRRSYNSSVLEPLLLWIGFFSTTLMFVVMDMVMVKGNEIITFIIVVHSAIWFMALIPIIGRSYEATNWRKAALFSKGLREGNFSHGEIRRRVKGFLGGNLSLAIGDESNREFDHLEHVLRLLDLWEGSRKELMEELDRREVM